MFLNPVHLGGIDVRHLVSPTLFHGHDPEFFGNFISLPCAAFSERLLTFGARAEHPVAHTIPRFHQATTPARIEVAREDVPGFAMTQDFSIAAPVAPDRRSALPGSAVDPPRPLSLARHLDPRPQLGRRIHVDFASLDSTADATRSTLPDAPQCQPT